MNKIFNWIRSRNKLFLKLLSVIERRWTNITIIAICLLTILILTPTPKCFTIKSKIYCIPNIPISIDYITLGAISALFFPILAVSFIFSSLNVRIDEIGERFKQDKLWIVYATTPNEDGEYNFTRFLRRRINDYYDLSEFRLFSLLAGAFTFIIF